MLFALLCALSQAGPAHVQASLLQLREAPETEAVAVGWLRIGTGVEVLDEEGDWLQVRVDGRPEAYPVEGWVLGRFLDVEAPTADLARARIRGAVDLEEEARWMDRLEALEGGRADPEAPIHVAVCAGGRAEYLGLVDPDEGFVDRAQWTAPRQALLDLSALHWTETRPGELARPIEGSPFVHPFLTDRWNERDGSPWAPGSCDGICEPDSRVVLGPCDGEGTLFTSQPVGSGPAEDWLADEVRVELHPYEHGDWLETKWDLAGPAWQQSLELGSTEVGEVEARDVPTNRVRLPDGRVLAVGAMRQRTVRGWVLALADRAGLRAWTLYVEGWGC